MSYLDIEGYHAFVTGARGGIGSAIVEELLAAGCRVTAHDIRPPRSADQHDAIFSVQGDVSDESSMANCIAQAVHYHGPINILCANAGITNESAHPPIWELPLETWEQTYAVNVRGIFLTIKHFLLAAKAAQENSTELENLAIVVTGSECGKFGQAGHAEYASGKAGLQYGLVPTVKNEIVRLNAKARINAVAPGWVNTELIGDRLDDPRELYMESQATVPLRKIAQPTDVAKAVAFLASHSASGHISGQCLSVDGGMEGRVVWREEEILKTGEKAQSSVAISEAGRVSTPSMPLKLPLALPRSRRKLKIALSIDFDAISSWLGTGGNPDNNLSDYSVGYFSATVGVPRLLKVLKAHSVASNVTWCIPGHTIETFPEQCAMIAATGAEIALHGYAHEGVSQLTAEQEEDILKKCISLTETLVRNCGGDKRKGGASRPVGYRAPLYKISERTLELLQKYDFSWDSSLSHFHSTPYFIPKGPIPTIQPLDIKPDSKAESWMHPSVDITKSTRPSSLVEIPSNWYEEDATPLQYYPNVANSHGYVDVSVIEKMWRNRFIWLLKELDDEEASLDNTGTEPSMKVFSLILHPETSGMAHVIGMIDEFISWIQREHSSRVEWRRFEEVAAEFRQRK